MHRSTSARLVAWRPATRADAPTRRGRSAGTGHTVLNVDAAKPILVVGCIVEGGEALTLAHAAQRNGVRLAEPAPERQGTPWYDELAKIEELRLEYRSAPPGDDAVTGPVRDLAHEPPDRPVFGHGLAVRCVLEEGREPIVLATDLLIPWIETGTAIEDVGFVVDTRAHPKSAELCEAVLDAGFELDREYGARPYADQETAQRRDARYLVETLLRPDGTERHLERLTRDELLPWLPRDLQAGQRRALIEIDGTRIKVRLETPNRPRQQG